MRSAIVACVLSIAASGFMSGLASAQTLPNHAIVNGHDVQPHADQFGNASTSPDIPRKDAEDVDRLYEQLMRATDPARARR
jgi:hypothetical protein